MTRLKIYVCYVDDIFIAPHSYDKIKQMIEIKLRTKLYFLYDPLYIYIYIYSGTAGKMVMVVENGRSEPSSNPEPNLLYFT